MSTSSFVHLKVHTDFSLHDGLMTMKELAGAVDEHNMPAIAVADHMNMFGAIKSFKQMQDKGVQPIVAIDIIIDGEGGRPHFMTLLAQNEKGYKNLCELISRGYQEGYIGETAYIKREWLEEKSDNLIALSGARKGNVGQALLQGEEEQAREHAEYWKSLFGNRYYLELQRLGHPDDETHIRGALEIAIEQNIPVVATNDVRFKNYEDFMAHQVRASIAKKVTLEEFAENYRHEYSAHQYLKSQDEMTALFADIPSAIQNSVEIAKRCSIDIELGNNYLPDFPTPDGMTQAELLVKESWKGLEARLETILDKNDSDYATKRKEYEDRLEFELKIVNDMGFPGYFLIVMEFIQWGKDNDVPIGPGRGSGAGSLVAYALKITDLDPLEYDLLFERFLNPERVSMPDFDIDFCKNKRDMVIQHTADTYGHDSVSQIVTYGTMAAKMVVRDIARALGKPFSFGNRLSNLVPDTLGITLKESMEDPTFRAAYETDNEIKTVIDYAMQLEGKTRQTGKHAGGVLISQGKLTDYTPTYNEADGSGFVSMYDKNDVEDAGLVKFDFLGLKTLTVIDGALKAINKFREQKGEEKLNINEIDLTDQKTFDEIFLPAKTTAVFQLESKGMKDLMKRLKPENFNDIIALVALYRPGPMDAGMVDTYVECKNGIREVELLHPMLEEVTGPTYGVLVYQEQVMQSAQVLAGYTLGGADMLRRAMGKKKPEEMEKQRSIFVEGCSTNNIEASEANRIFNLIEKFAGYGFNKSHSAAYALLSFQTAWLKAHYPAEFMASVMTLDQNDLDKVVNLMNECREMGLEVTAPDVNSSGKDFTADEKGRIVFGLTAIKGIGPSEVDKIIAERDANGPFSDLYDFQIRTNAKKNTIEAAIRSGAFDKLHDNRASLMATYPKAKDIGRKMREKKKETSTAQLGMFEMEEESLFDYVDMPQWDLREKLAGERKTMGLYLTGHPIEQYDDELKHIVTGKLSNLTELPDVDEELMDEDIREMIAEKKKKRRVHVAGLVMDIKEIKTKKGTMAVITIDDNSRQIEATLYANTYNRYRHLIQLDKPLILDGTLYYDKVKQKYRLNPRVVETIDMMRESKVSNLMLSINKALVQDHEIEHVKDLLKNNPRGSCRIELEFEGRSNRRMQLDNAFNVALNDDLINKIKNILGPEKVKIEYKSEKKGMENAPVAIIEESQEDKEFRRLERRKNINRLFDDAVMSMSE